MKPPGISRYPVLIACLFISACGSPSGTQAQRNRIKPVAMTAEAIQKIVLEGSLVSLIRNPFSSTRKGFSMLRNRSKIIVDSGIRHFTQTTPPPRTAISIDDALNALGYPKPIPGQLNFLIDGKAFFDDLHRSVRSAQKRVDTQIFIFDNDDVATSYADLLREKSAHIRCRVLFDELGSLSNWWIDPDSPMPHNHRPPASMINYLKDNSHVKVRVSRNPWLVADHTKLILIDRKIAYLGGMNIGREYRYDWHDMMVRIQGPVVTALQNNFDRSWRLQGGLGDWTIPFHRRLKHRTTLARGEIGIRILKTTPGHNDIKNAMLTAIRMSQKRIYLHVAYFTSDVFLRELIKARQRGVDVRMIFPVKIDSALLNTGNRAAARKLVEHGAQVFLYPKASHTKALVVDDWACLGSANLDALSLRINTELNIAFSDPSTVKRLIKELFTKDFKKSKHLTRRDVRNWMDSPAKIIAEQL